MEPEMNYEKLLARVKYKPGWQFVLRPAAADFAHLEIQAVVHDSWPPHKSITICMNYAFNAHDWPNESTFYGFVRASIQRTEQHEFNEWFRVDDRAWPTADHATF